MRSCLQTPLSSAYLHSALLRFRLPSERALKSVPHGKGRPRRAPAGTMNKTVVLKRGNTGPNEIQTWEPASLPPVSGAGIYPHPEVCFAIKLAFLKFSYFSYLLLSRLCTLSFPQPLSLKTNAIFRLVTHVVTTTTVETRWRKSGCCSSMRQLDLEHSYGRASFPGDVYTNKKADGQPNLS